MKDRSASQSAVARGKDRPHISPARRAAFHILCRVEQENAFSSILLSTNNHLSPEDRGLCHEIVLGVLRWQMWLDRLIEHFAGRQAYSLDMPVRQALRIGLYQLRFLNRIPPSAAVNESVNLAYLSNLKSSAGFINANLRRSIREPDYDPVTGIEDPIERVAVESSHPEWLIRNWMDAFGVDETLKLVEINNRPPEVSFRVTGHAEEKVLEEIRNAGGEVFPSQVVKGAWRVTGVGGALLNHMAVQGLIYLQDEASQLIAHLVDPRPDEKILDVCAAPGSKTTLMSQIAGSGSTLVACDLYLSRLSTVVDLSQRQGLSNIHTLLHDAEKALPFAPETFDKVLVDAPCSGTGTLRHNPEIKWRISPSDVLELSGRQKAILSNASTTVRTGGRLIYSTCSLEPAENEMIVSWFLANHPDFRLDSRHLPEEFITPAGTLRTWPQKSGTDGFFMARFERLT
jgi:16S rRNA (cytosine967-C5)-methyltransferase